MITRRQAITRGAALAGTALALARSRDAAAAQGDVTGQGWQRSYSGGPEVRPARPGMPNRDYVPTITPGGATLPFKVVEDTKVFHLVAEEVEHTFAPGLRARCWGYNGSGRLGDGTTTNTRTPVVVQAP